MVAPKINVLAQSKPTTAVNKGKQKLLPALKTSIVSSRCICILLLEMTLILSFDT